jgi:hypothetical protein
LYNFILKIITLRKVLIYRRVWFRERGGVLFITKNIEKEQRENWSTLLLSFVLLKDSYDDVTFVLVWLRVGVLVRVMVQINSINQKHLRLLFAEG